MLPRAIVPFTISKDVPYIDVQLIRELIPDARGSESRFAGAPSLDEQTADNKTNARAPEDTIQPHKYYPSN